MKYMVKGKLDIVLNCSCPNCDGIDTWEDHEKIEMEMEADKESEAARKVLFYVYEQMSHEDAEVNWEKEPEIIEIKDGDIGVDVQLLKLGATPLFSLEGILKQ